MEQEGEKKKKQESKQESTPPKCRMHKWGAIRGEYTKPKT